MSFFKPAKAKNKQMMYWFENENNTDVSNNDSGELIHN